MTFNKKLLPLAIAAVLAAPAAALADSTLYGQVHLSLDNIDDGDDSGAFLSSNSSRLGVKGSEDLGNGLAVFYQLEGGIGFDGSSNIGDHGGAWRQFFGVTRDSYVGLRSDMGSVQAGHLSGLNQYVYDANLFGNEIGDPAAMTTGLGGGRWANAVRYTTPDFSGFKLSATYAFDENTAVSTDRWSLRGTYNNGPLFLALTHINYDKSSPTPDVSTTALTGTYDFSGFKLVGSVNSDSDIGGKSIDRTVWSIGGKLPLGPGSAKLQYTSADDLDQSNDTGGSLVAVGYEYPLSKRTMVYVDYATADNDANASFMAADDWGHGEVVAPASAGENTDAFSLGIVHKF